MVRHEYRFKKLVIGGSLAALVYAYHESLPIIWTEPKIPYFFDKTVAGKSKKEIWHKMAFLLSLAGLAPVGDKAESYRIEGNTIKVFGAEPYFVQISFDEVVHFDIDTEKQKKNLEVIDWVDVRRGTSHEHDYLGSPSRFVRHIYFYESPRIDGVSGLKDLVAVSYMSPKQLEQVEYSETYVRLKLIDVMKQHGIRGAKNGIGLKGKQKYLTTKLEPRLREIRINDSKREDELLKKYANQQPSNEQLVMWSDVLGSPYG